MLLSDGTGKAVSNLDISRKEARNTRQHDVCADSITRDQRRPGEKSEEYTD